MSDDRSHDLELAYVQKDPRTGEFISATAYNFWDGCRLLGIPTEPFDAAQIDDLPLTPRTLVHGGVGAVMRALARLGVPAPHVDGAPAELGPYFGRRVWQTTMGALRASDDGAPVFVKPLREAKLFTGHVRDGSMRSLTMTAHVDDGVALLASEVVPFVTEYRCFVHRGRVVGAKHYGGDWRAPPPDFGVADAAAAAFAGAPVAYAIDLGVADDGRTLIVEVNDAFALGCYGLAPVPYARLVEDRWLELTAPR
jgi:hypothetical protein